MPIRWLLFGLVEADPYIPGIVGGNAGEMTLRAVSILLGALAEASQAPEAKGEIRVNPLTWGRK